MVAKEVAEGKAWGDSAAEGAEAELPDPGAVATAVEAALLQLYGAWRWRRWGRRAGAVSAGPGVRLGEWSAQCSCCGSALRPGTVGAWGCRAAGQGQVWGCWVDTCTQAPLAHTYPP